MHRLENNGIFVNPISTNCKKLAAEKEHVLIGISPFNSYYSEERIERLICWGKDNFNRFHLFVPDTLPYFNFLALGYSNAEAQKKTKRQWNYLRNKINKAFIANGLCFNKDASKLVTLGETLLNNEEYTKLKQYCLNKYNNDPLFKKKCLDVSKMVLCGYCNKADDAKLEDAVQYLLAELPLFFDTPKILKIDSSLFVYHEKIDFFADLYNIRDDERLASNQGHLIVKII